MSAFEDIGALGGSPLEDFTHNEMRLLKHACERNGLVFMRVFFKLRESFSLIENLHHRIMQDALDRVISGEITRLIINVPPGYTKTEQAVINFITRGLALNPRAKFIHCSYSGDLAQESSSTIKENIERPEFQALWPMSLRNDKRGKKRWFTSLGGGMMAAPAGGQITGFRAGRMEPGFTGAFIIDDPVKPDDAYSVVERTKINNRFNNTMRSRLAVETVPMIVIMQRIHEDDMTGFLLKGGSGDKWHHLVLPGLVTEEFLNSEYPKEYTHGIPMKYDLPLGPLWEKKHTEEQLRVLEQGDPYTYSAQIQQNPSPAGGGMFKDKWWKYFDILPNDIDVIRIYGDTAQKTKERNDYSVFIVVARSRSRGIFIVDLVRGKWEAPMLESTLVELWNKWKPTQFKPQGAQCVKVEDKSSGSSLIQSIRNDYMIPIEGIQRNTDKVLRAMGIVKYIASGYVHLPKDAPWVFDYKDEFRKFTPLMTHPHDDQIDPTIDAIEDLIVYADMLYTDDNI